jgi:transposase-like protein
LEWKRSVVEQTFEPGASVARVARDNNINANQLWAWRKLHAQGLLVDIVQTEAMLPVVVMYSPIDRRYRRRTRRYLRRLQTAAFGFSMAIRRFG